jgi:hypothetical protein
VGRRIFELYCLRRPDRDDLLEPGNWCPFYGGRGRYGRENAHRKEALKLITNPKAKNTNPIRNYIIHKLWEQGLDFVEDVIFIELTNEEANEMEKEFIAAYGRIDNKTGCLSNLNDGGEGQSGFTHSEATRQKLREARKNYTITEATRQKLREAFTGENHWNWGKKASEETKKRQRESHLGVPLSESHKQNISKATTGENHPMHGKHHKPESLKLISENHADVSGEKNPFYNKKHTEKSLRKMSESSKGQVAWNRGISSSEIAKQKMRDTKRRRFAEKVYIRDIVERMIQIGDDYGEDCS